MIGVDFLVNITAGLALIAIGYTSRKAVFAFRTRNERRLWRPLRSGAELRVAITTRPGPLKRSTPRVSLSEVRVLTGIIPTLLRLGIRYSLTDSFLQNLDGARRCNYLILGGPAVNELSAEALRLLDPRLPAGFDLSEVAITISNRRYAPTYDEQTGLVQKDYGLVIRAQNPFSEGRPFSIILVMGCHGYGTAGAANLLTSEKLAAELLRKIGDDSFLAIVSVTMAGTGYDTKIEEIYGLVPVE
jgi:hypothetical protein